MTTIIYGGGPFYNLQLNTPDVSLLKQSGFTTVMCWALHIDNTANMSFNNESIIEFKNGRFEYTGLAEWPSVLANLKEGDTKVNRLMFSIGGWGVDDFYNMKNLIFAKEGSYPNNPDISPNSTLYKAFNALKEAIPTIDGFDLDDEPDKHPLDQPTIVALSTMLANMGYQVTFCPYDNMNIWINCLMELNTSESGTGPVTGFNLQCYAGGGGNNPDNWIQAIQAAMKLKNIDFNAKGFVFPGLSCEDTLGYIESTFNGWQSNNSITGGFIWRYGKIQGSSISLSAYPAAITSGLS